MTPEGENGSLQQRIGHRPNSEGTARYYTHFWKLSCSFFFFFLIFCLWSKYSFNILSRSQCGTFHFNFDALILNWGFSFFFLIYFYSLFFLLLSLFGGKYVLLLTSNASQKGAESASFENANGEKRKKKIKSAFVPAEEAKPEKRQKKKTHWSRQSSHKKKRQSHSTDNNKHAAALFYVSISETLRNLHVIGKKTKSKGFRIRMWRGEERYLDVVDLPPQHPHSLKPTTSGPGKQSISALLLLLLLLPPD